MDHKVWGQKDHPSGLDRNPVQIFALNVYVLSHHSTQGLFSPQNTTGVLVV